MLHTVSRRKLIRNGGLVSAGLIIGGAVIPQAVSAPAVSLDAFISLSEKITGQQSLDGNMAKSILEAFTTSGRAEEIASLVEDPAPERSGLAIASSIVAAWYSGLSPISGAPEVAGFNEALLWNALGYTKPWGSCGGDVGYWGAPPSEQEL